MHLRSLVNTIFKKTETTVVKHHAKHHKINIISQKRSSENEHLAPLMVIPDYTDMSRNAGY